MSNHSQKHVKDVVNYTNKVKLSFVGCEPLFAQWFLSFRKKNFLIFRKMLARARVILSEKHFINVIIPVLRLHFSDKDVEIPLC